MILECTQLVPNSNPHPNLPHRRPEAIQPWGCDTVGGSEIRRENPPFGDIKPCLVGG